MTHYLGMFIICAGVPVVLSFFAMLVLDAVLCIKGKTSLFDRHIPPPKPCPPRR